MENEKADERELILINVTGADRCGVTTALTEILARYDADILDMGQALSLIHISEPTRPST